MAHHNCRSTTTTPHTTQYGDLIDDFEDSETDKWKGAEAFFITEKQQERLKNHMNRQVTIGEFLRGDSKVECPNCHAHLGVDNAHSIQFMEKVIIECDCGEELFSGMPGKRRMLGRKPTTPESPMNSWTGETTDEVECPECKRKFPEGDGVDGDDGTQYCSLKCVNEAFNP